MCPYRYREHQKIDTKSGKESILVTLEEVNEALKNGEMPYKLTGHIKPLRTLMAASLPWGDRNVITFTQYDDRTPGQKYMIWYDFSKKKIVNLFNLQEKVRQTSISAKKMATWHILSEMICM